LEERFFFVGGARANALACPMFTLFPSAPDTHTYNLNFSIYHRFEKSAVNSGLVFKQVKLIKKGVI
jgi:hypothetical protein